MRIETIHNADELESIKGIWGKFELYPNGSTLFQSWLRNRVWCDEGLAFNLQMRLGVKLVEDTVGRHVSILPFFEQGIMRGLLWVTRFLGDRKSPYNDILLADPNDIEVCEPLLHLQVESKPEGNIICHN